jgi:AraC-like DNA-binding protein
MGKGDRHGDGEREAKPGSGHGTDTVRATPEIPARGVAARLEKRDDVAPTERRRDAGPARGVLQAGSDAGRFHHARIGPLPALADLVQHYWSVRWELDDDAPQTRETLPHPNVHLVFDAGGARVHGIARGRFTTTLAGRGGVFGVKFRAGGFRPWLGRPVASLRGTSMPLRELHGDAADEVSKEIAACADDVARVATMERFLLAHRPPFDPQVERAARLVAMAEQDRTLLGAAQLAQREGLSLRALQRFFEDYVGIGPKWVINRYRLHEALERVHAGEDIDWSALALDLGYFDQAHFARDFKALIGRAPSAYQRSMRDR